MLLEEILREGEELLLLLTVRQLRRGGLGEHGQLLLRPARAVVLRLQSLKHVLHTIFYMVASVVQSVIVCIP